MSHVPATLPDQLAPITAIVENFRGARTDLDQFVGELLDRIDSESQRHADEQSKADALRQSLENQVDQLQSALDESQQTCDTAGEQDEQLTELRTQLDELNRESADRTETIQVLTAERDAVREKHEQARAEIETLREQLATQPETDTSEATEQLDALASQKQELQKELDAVRGRAVELNERLRDTERQAAEERAEWKTELKHMRRLLEQQPAEQAQAQQSTPMVAMPAAPATHADAVLSNVMAQFELVQQDVARRRSAG